MRRVLQQSLVFGGLAVLGAVALLLAGDPRSNAEETIGPRVDKLQHKSYSETIPDSKVKFEMVAVPGGVYMMGSPENEPGRNADEGPQHLVQIRPFWMGKCEVTWDEFDIYQEEKGLAVNTDFDKVRAKDPDAITGPTPPYVDKDYDHGHSGHPAICMSHHCAMEYCRWLSKKTGKHYRLPTEAEWEWAARAGSKTAYSFGDDPKQLKDYAWYIENSPDDDHQDGTTHKVGTKKGNAWGLHDMYGNVAEWCVDLYKKDAYADFAKQKLSLSPVVLPNADRFPNPVRGGSWSDKADKCRSAARRSSDKSWLVHDPQQPKSIWWLTKMDVIGFRVVCAVEEQDNLKGIKSKVTRQSQ